MSDGIEVANLKGFFSFSVLLFYRVVRSHAWLPSTFATYFTNRLHSTNLLIVLLLFLLFVIVLFLARCRY